MNLFQVKRIMMLLMAKKEYDRAAKLVQRQIVSEKDFNAIKENYETAKLAFEALAVNKSGKG